MNNSIKMAWVAFSLLVAARFDFCPSFAYELTIKVNELNSNVVTAVALLGQERTIHAQAGTDMFGLIARYCGTSNAKGAYVGVFISRNRDNVDIAGGNIVFNKDTDLVLPACLFANDREAKIGADVNGPLWSKPLIVTSRIPQNNILISDASSTPPCESSASSARVPSSCRNTINGPPQQVDRHDLSLGVALPLSLSSLGKHLPKQVTSLRLEDKSANERYQQLLKVALTLDLSKLSDKARLNAASMAFEQTLRSQDVKALNGEINYNKMQTSQRIASSSFRPDFYSFQLKPDLDKTTVSKTLMSSGVSRYIRTDAYIPILAELQSTADGPCGGLTGGSQLSDEIWPINIAELSMALRLRRAAGRITKFGPVLIFDTGLPKGVESNIPLAERFFIKNPSSQTYGELDPYVWPSQPGTGIYFAEGFEKAFHGLEVTSTALGGIGILKSGLLKDYVEMPDGALIEQMGYVKYEDPGTTDWIIDPNTLFRAFQGLQTFDGPRVSGVNLSLQYDVDANTVNPSEMVKSHADILYTFAAGNNSSDFASQKYYPADLGGNTSANAITVAALQPDYTLWEKSNRNGFKVDIAAPGCGVPTLIWDEDANGFKRVLANGTSLSAPLVAFAGSLLADDFRRASDIKLRLLASGRFSPSLEKDIFSMRALDVPNALVPHLTTLRMRDGTLRFGYVDWPQTGGSYVCSKLRNRSDILQIAFWTDAKGTLWLNSVVRGTGGTFRRSPTPDCLSGKDDFKGVTFREAYISDNKIIFGKESEPIDPIKLESITFCSGVKCSEPGEDTPSQLDEARPITKPSK